MILKICCNSCRDGLEWTGSPDRWQAGATDSHSGTSEHSWGEDCFFQIYVVWERYRQTTWQATCFQSYVSNLSFLWRLNNVHEVRQSQRGVRLLESTKFHNPAGLEILYKRDRNAAMVKLCPTFLCIIIPWRGVCAFECVVCKYNSRVFL